MSEPLEEYKTLLGKYYALAKLTESEMNGALNDLSSAINHMNSSIDYMRAQTAMRHKINQWIHDYGDLYHFNCQCKKCLTLTREINQLTTTIMELNHQSCLLIQNAHQYLTKAKSLHQQATTLKRRYDHCLQPENEE